MQICTKHGRQRNDGWLDCSLLHTYVHHACSLMHKPKPGNEATHTIYAHMISPPAQWHHPIIISNDHCIFPSQLTSPPFSSGSIIFSWTPLMGLPQLPTLHPLWLCRRFSVWHPEHSLNPYISMRGILMNMKNSWTSLCVGAAPTPNIMHSWKPKALRYFLNTRCFASAHPQGREWLEKVPSKLVNTYKR